MKKHSHTLVSSEYAGKNKGTLIKNPNSLSSIRHIILAVCLLLVVWSTVAQRNPGQNPPNAIHPTRILAKLKRNVAPQAAMSLHEEQGLTVHRKVPVVPGLLVLDARSGASNTPRTGQEKEVLAQIGALRASGLYEYVEPDYRVQADVFPVDAAFSDGRLWGLRNIGQNGGISGADIGVVNAWDITTGSTNVIVAIIDTGIRYTHQDLTTEMWRNPGEIPDNGIDDDGDGYVDNVYGMNAINGSGNPFDDNNHGTHVSGTIGAAAENAGSHVGVAWQVRLMACKFLDADGSGYTSDAIECINFAVSKGAKILNNSWGGGGYSQALYDAIAAAANAGVLFVAAAGNNGLDTDFYPNYPSGYDLGNVIAVAALDRSDNLAPFSNYGRNSVDLGAPGVEIFSSTAGSDSEYQYLDGTSMAAPHVSGVAALIAARFPGISLTELRQRLIATVVPVPALAGRSTSGGRVNAYNALTASADGVLEVATSTSMAPPLLAGAHVGLYVKVSDLFPVANATITGQVVGGGELTFSNDGIIPDEAAGDNIYSATLPVPLTGGDVRIRLVISAPGKMSTTTTMTFTTRILPPVQSITPGLVLAIAQQEDGKIIIGGYFSVVNGAARNNIARLNVDGSLDQTWNPGANDAVRRIAVSGTDVFVLGDFYTIGGRARNGLAKLSATGDGAADPLWNPNHPANLHALAVSGSDLFVGGLSYLAKLSTTGTGAADAPWGAHLQPDNNIVVLAVRGTNLYAGGNFSQLGGVSRRALAKVSTPGTGELDSAWDPMVRGAFGGPVNALVSSGDDLLVGGSFTSVGGLPRTNLAKVSATGSAAVDSQWNPDAIGPITGWSRDDGVEAGRVYDLASDGINLYVAGLFYSTGGSMRTNLAKVSVTGGGTANPLWQPDTQGQWVTALAVSGGSLLVGGDFASINGQPCFSFAKLDPLTGVPYNSFEAQVGFTLPPSLLRFSASEGLTLSGTPGGIYQIECSENFNQPTNWLPLTTVTLSEYSMAIPGTRPVGKRQCFYRAQLLSKP